MANPPFNVDMVDAEKVKDDRRLPFGLPGVNKAKKVSNGNYLWISYFHSYLGPKGRAGFVMSSQASSAGHGEADVRRKLVETGDVDVMISIRSNFFYTRTVPCELWHLDRGKPKERRDQVLMLDARHDLPQGHAQDLRLLARADGQPDRRRRGSIAGSRIVFWAWWSLKGLVKQVDLLYKLSARAGQLAIEIEGADLDRRKLGNSIKLLEEHRKAAVEQLKHAAYFHRQIVWLQDRFPQAEMQDVPGLCKVVTRKEIEKADWSLTPGRYVGVAPPEVDEDFDFEQAMHDIHVELADLNKEAVALARKIQANFEELGI
jgi:type I restriction-modification system DNA methylase subunit